MLLINKMKNQDKTDKNQKNYEYNKMKLYKKINLFKIKYKSKELINKKLKYIILIKNYKVQFKKNK